MLQNSFSLSNLSCNVDNGNGGSLVAAVLPAGSSDLAGTGSTIFSGGLFWRQLRFGGNWLHIIFCLIVLEAAQIWRELAPHYFPDVNARIFYQGIFPRASWQMAYLLGCNKSKVHSRHSNQWPDDCTFFSGRNFEPVKTIRALLLLIFC